MAKLISLRVPTDLLKQLGQLAEDEMKDRSEFTRELLVLRVEGEAVGFQPLSD